MDVGVAGSLLVCAWVVAWNVGRGWHRGFAGVTASLVVCVGLWKVSSARVAVVGPTLLSVQTSRPEVALTFDDGPSSAYTNTILDLLAEADAQATFFVVGRELQQNPEAGRALLAAGHQLGNHSWSHPRLIFRTDRTLRAEVTRTDAALRDLGVTGEIPFRPPYGKRLWSLHRVLGDRPAVLWDVEPESYPTVAADPERLAAHVLERVRPGSIVLLHAMYTSREVTRQALPLILEGLERKGLKPVTLRALRQP